LVAAERGTRQRRVSLFHPGAYTSGPVLDLGRDSAHHDANHASDRD
jgi:hypothetical protein